MAGETDLAAMLGNLEVHVRPERYTFVTIPPTVPASTVPASTVLPPLGDGVAAIIGEEEGVTVVVEVGRARAEGWPVTFEAAWLTLAVHSALDGVGLTAAVATALARHGIACNVLAANFHDHLLVPADRVEEAVVRLHELRSAT